MLSGSVWVDNDGDSLEDVGELPLASVNITVFDFDTNETVGSVLSNSTGLWFLNLPPGTYFAVISPPPQYVLSPGGDFDPTSLATASKDLTSPGVSDEVNAGLFIPATIQGSLWDDTDGDGIEDAGEEPYTGNVTVYLYEADNSTVPVQTISTSNGNFTFENVPPGDYEIVFDTGSGTSLSPNVTGGSDADPETGSLTQTVQSGDCLLYTSPSPRDISGSRMPSSA